MHYWWVNQKQTYRHEVPGGYLWSPKRNKNHTSNRAYDAMRTICPGDIVFSFADAQIKAVGIATSYCYEFPKPTEFGVVGSNWENIGWRVDVNFRELPIPVRPKDHIDTIRPLLPSKYSPLQNNGNGNQVFYLYDISLDLAIGIAHLFDRWVVDLVNRNLAFDLPQSDSSVTNIEKWEEEVEKQLKESNEIPDQEREVLIKARKGQGRYRTEMLLIEGACRVTKVNNPVHLIASHTKPWRDCTNAEKIDPENGFMLTPTVDHLFDRGFISFDRNGDLIVSKVAHQDSMRKMGLPGSRKLNVGSFTQGQQKYLDWHRDFILL